LRHDKRNLVTAIRTGGANASVRSGPGRQIGNADFVDGRVGLLDSMSSIAAPSARAGEIKSGAMT